MSVLDKNVLDHHAAPAAGLEDFDEVLEKEKRGLAGPNGKILLHFRAFLAAKGRIGQHHVVPVLFLDVG